MEKYKKGFVVDESQTHCAFADLTQSNWGENQSRKAIEVRVANSRRNELEGGSFSFDTFSF